MEIYIINLLIYQALLIPIIFFSILYYVLGFTAIAAKLPRYTFNKIRDIDLPKVTIQIPVYNDPVAIRCVKKCLKFNYPKNKFDIIVADDSTDPLTKKILDKYVKGKNQVKLIRRATREGFKPGALNAVLPHTKGDIICIFDSDFVPNRNFLRKLVTPFANDSKTAIVQSRMGFVNYNTNIVSKFAAILLMIYHNCIMPISYKMNAAFFCGTGGAIKKSVLLEAGGWNQKSITEDADLSVVLLEKGYRSLYLHNLVVPGEVPFSLRSFLKQQMRWAYGITRVFMDRWRQIFFSKNFSMGQRGMLTYITSSYITAPIVFLVALTGQLGWVLTPPTPLALSDLIKFLITIGYTSGFVFLIAIGLYRSDEAEVIWKTSKGADFVKLFISSMIIGIILSFTNMIAFFKAVFGFKGGWIRTPKMGSISIAEFFKKLFSRKKTSE